MYNPSYTLFLKLIINIFLPNISATSLHLDASTFKNCIFNLVASGEKSARHDFTDILLNENQAGQLWTMTTLKGPENGTIVKWWILQYPMYFKEICSVNIVIGVRECFEYGVIQVFDSRIFNIANTLILIMGPNSGCNPLEGTLRNEWGPTLVVDIGLIYLSENELDVADILLYCSACSVEHSVTPFRKSLTGLAAFRKFGDMNRRVALLKYRYIAVFRSEDHISGTDCNYLYPRMYLTQAPARCYPDLFFIYNAASNLNMTLGFHQAFGMGSQFFKLDTPYMVIAVLDIFTWSIWSPIGPNMHLMTQVHHSSIEAKYFYCTKSKRRESFNFFFWVTPFDTWCWGLILSSVFSLIILLGMRWFEVYAILMRQECKVLRKKKVLVFFIFASIVFTYGYEGVISSLLTVPPPYFVMTHLKEIIENGYKIFGVSERGEMFDRLREFFQMLNITASVESSIVPESRFLSSNDAVIALSQCNVTYTVATNMEKSWQAAVAEVSPETSCYYGKKATMEVTPLIYTFSGYSKQALTKIAVSFQETGILSMYMNFMFTSNTVKLRRQRILTEQKAKSAAPFELRDWKILSIFVLWGLLLGFACITCVAEFLSPKKDDLHIVY